MALIQENVKRLLAYSSIGHAGYLMVALVTGTVEGYTAVLFYLIAYTFMTLGAFGVVVALAHGGRDFEKIESFASKGKAKALRYAEPGDSFVWAKINMEGAKQEAGGVPAPAKPIVDAFDGEAWILARPSVEL